MKFGAYRGAMLREAQHDTGGGRAKNDTVRDQDLVRDSYDAVAVSYAEHVADELKSKPFDRAFLERVAVRLKGRGTVCEVGCGPGHVTRYLHDRGVHIRGLDLSPEMIHVAHGLNPGIEFVEGDFLAMPFADAALEGIVSFYSVLHLEPGQRSAAFLEMRRVLKPGGVLVLATHAGNESFAVPELFGHPVTLHAHFIEVEDLRRELETAGFTVEELLERDPYPPEVEYQSRRVYLTASLPKK